VFDHRVSHFFLRWILLVMTCQAVQPIQNLHARRLVVSAKPRRLYVWKETQYALHRKLYEPRRRLRWVRRNSFPQGFEPRAIQPLSIRYTDYVIMAPRDKYTPAKTKIVKYRVFLNIVQFFYTRIGDGDEVLVSVTVFCGIMFVRYFPQFCTNTIYSYSFSYCAHFQGRHYTVE
jgi:hypothetical protein